jgi:hypothetical protein
MTSGRHQGSLGSILEIFAAPIRQIFAGIDAPAIGAPIIRVFTQPGSKPEHTFSLCMSAPASSLSD